MKLTENAVRVLQNRYLRKNAEGEVLETHDEMFRRVAASISQAELKYNDDEANREHWEGEFLDIMTNLEFLPNSPTLMNAGTDIQQLAACFVLPVDDSMDSIFESVKNAALIHKSGGGTGFAFSRLRPKNDVVRSTKGISSGPISFMTVFDAATEAVKQGGRRRGANMAILRVDHPDIMDFIESKKNTDRLTNFNISVAVTEEFMKAAMADTEYDLINPRTGDAEGRLPAWKVFQSIVEAAWRNGEPGIVFIDRINRDNPTPMVGSIESTNPCGEQPLLAYESCNLGSLNLKSVVAGENGEAHIDYDRLRKNVSVAVRFLDNVIDMSKYPIPEIDRMTKANRKIGLGVMGFADMLIKLGIPYDSDEAVSTAEEVMQFIQVESKAATLKLAEERGAFPNFPGSIYDKRGEPPHRNATTTTIAPTGTISIIANTSSGIEPIFAVGYVRNVMENDELVEVNPLFKEIAEAEGFANESLMKEIAESGTVQHIEEIPERWREVFRCAYDINPDAHVRMQAAFQKYTDNAVSKTVNFPKEARAVDVEEVFMLAYQLGCKGVTIYRDGSREAQVLNIGEVNRRETGDYRVPRKRPEFLEGKTRKKPTGCGNLYVTINGDRSGPFELFAQIGKAGGCAASQAEAIGRLISLALRAGVDPTAIVKQLRGVRCPSPAWDDGKLVLSCSDAISKALEQHLTDIKFHDPDSLSLAAESLGNRLAGLCIDCGNALEFDGGCNVCRNCGYSRCG
ncbi:MAG: vitamin B12-dependent ribonucleotide reductase [Candidatus Latescibacterota bacterium]|nr:MAG: vitamin B12-dependent ribonucleotide reductase [Candidatus Latescibacterota bacterium]